MQVWRSFSRAIDYFHVCDDLKKSTADLDANKHHAMSTLLEQLITLRMIGGEAVSDTELLKDTALGALFDWDEIAHPIYFRSSPGRSALDSQSALTTHRHRFE